MYRIHPFKTFTFFSSCIRGHGFLRAGALPQRDHSVTDGGGWTSIVSTQLPRCVADGPTIHSLSSEATVGESPEVNRRVLRVQTDGTETHGNPDEISDKTSSRGTRRMREANISQEIRARQPNNRSTFRLSDGQLGKSDHNKLV